MKAILFVSFGSTHQDAYAAGIKPLLEELAETGLPVYEAITSRFVKRKLEQQGVAIDSLEQALERLVADGVQEVLVVNNFVLPAFEYVRMKHKVYRYREQFTAQFTPALLERMADQDTLIEYMQTLYAEAGKTLYILGHGSEHPAGAILSQLQLLAEQKGYDQIYQSIDGFPDQAAAMSRLAAGKPVILVPLLFVAGDHGKNDTADLADVLRQAGHQVDRRVIGLGEQALIRQMILNHV